MQYCPSTNIATRVVDTEDEDAAMKMDVALPDAKEEVLVSGLGDASNDEQPTIEIKGAMYNIYLVYFIYILYT